MSYVVYCHTNKLDNKRYVGITKQKPEKRWRNGEGYKSNEYFYNAIKKYGWEEFSHDILFTNLSKEDAEKKEIELIAKWNLTNKDEGYNIESGGNLGKEVNYITKIKLSEITKAQMTDSAREHLRQCAVKQFATKGHPCLGKIYTEEHKHNISEGHNHHKIKICQYDTCGNLLNIYDSLHDMERKTGFARSYVSNYIKGKTDYCYGFVWKKLT